MDLAVQSKSYDGVHALDSIDLRVLTLMLGTLLDSGGPIIPIPLAFAFGQQLIAGIPGLGAALPWALVVGAGDANTSVTAAFITGEPLPAPAALVTTAVACAAFTAVAFWKWRRTEL
jgi:hypothetical protein